MNNKIFVYNDEGVDGFSLQELKQCLETVRSADDVQLVNADEIKNGVLSTANVVLFCIGGGRDIPYLAKLGKTGCEQIRRFVHSGGCYLGICAGAYFAADYIEFDLNGPLEVKGERELKFFKGKCVGPVNRNFQYDDNDLKATAAQVSIGDKRFFYYLNGGCRFEAYTQENDDVNIIANYTDDATPAIIECNYGNGKCLLSGLHIEYNPEHLTRNSALRQRVTHDNFALIRQLLHKQ